MQFSSWFPSYFLIPEAVVRRYFSKQLFLKIYENGKRLSWILFFLKLLVWRPATLLKRDSNTGAFLFYRTTLVAVSDSLYFCKWKIKSFWLLAHDVLQQSFDELCCIANLNLPTSFFFKIIFNIFKLFFWVYNNLLWGNCWLIDTFNDEIQTHEKISIWCLCHVCK